MGHLEYQAFELFTPFHEKQAIEGYFTKRVVGKLVH